MIASRKIASPDETGAKPVQTTGVLQYVRGPGLYFFLVVITIVDF